MPFLYTNDISDEIVDILAKILAQLGIRDDSFGHVNTCADYSCISHILCCQKRPYYCIEFNGVFDK